MVTRCGSTGLVQRSRCICLLQSPWDSESSAATVSGAIIRESVVPLAPETTGLARRDFGLVNSKFTETLSRAQR